jgi:hypothetical protein
MVIFYGWLEQHKPELLKRGQGNPYQQQKTDLASHIR